MAEPSVTMKLLINTQAKRVLFAEARKDCIDFLFDILSLPVATVVALLKKEGVTSSLCKLHDSVENLDDSYLQPNQNKDAILKPVVPNHGSSVPLLTCNTDAAIPTQKIIYRCGYCNYQNYTDDPRTICSNCKQKMAVILTYKAPPGAAEGSKEGGYVKGVVTYMVMDDLEVKPMSTISCIALLNKFEVKDVGVLEERVVKLGTTEAVSLLKASMQSNQVLTDVFVEVGVCGSGSGSGTQTTCPVVLPDSDSQVDIHQIHD